MKKVIFSFLLFFASMTALNATIILEGTHTGDSFLLGTITVICKASDADCVIINATAGTYLVNIPDVSDEWFECESFSTSEISGGVQVKLYGVK